MTQKTQKKPVVVEFVRLTESNILEAYTFVFGKPDLSTRIASDKWETYEDIVKRDGMKLKTPESGEGTQIASIGDCIIKGNSPELGDHFWPVKPDYFENAYQILP